MTEAMPVDGVMPTVYLTSYQDVSTGLCLLTRGPGMVLTLPLN